MREEKKNNIPVHIVWMTGVKRRRAPRHFIWLCTLSASLLTQRESHFFSPFLFDPSIPLTRSECEARECVREIGVRLQTTYSN